MMAGLYAREKHKSNVLIPNMGKSQPAGIFSDEPSALAAASMSVKGQEFISYQEVLDELPLSLEKIRAAESAENEPPVKKLKKGPSGTDLCSDCDVWGEPLSYGARCSSCKRAHCMNCWTTDYLSEHEYRCRGRGKTNFFSYFSSYY